MVKQSRVAQNLIKKCIKAVGVWYRVDTFTNKCPDSKCELSCGWGHIQNNCGSKPKCGYWSSYHQTRDHKCNVVGCTTKQESLCSHVLQQSPDCKGNHIEFSSRCKKKSEAAKAVLQYRES